ARLGGDILLQDDLRDGTALGVLLHGERPAKVLDDVVGNGKAKAEALAYALGGEERVEDAASDCVGNAGAVVAHRDGDLAPADALGGKGDGAVFGSLYRVGRVGDDVDEDLLQPHRSRLHPERRWAQLHR